MACVTTVASRSECLMCVDAPAFRSIIASAGEGVVWCIRSPPPAANRTQARAITATHSCAARTIAKYNELGQNLGGVSAYL